MASRVAAIGGEGSVALVASGPTHRQPAGVAAEARDNIAKRLLGGRAPTAKQSEWAVPILDEAIQLGFES